MLKLKWKRSVVVRRPSEELFRERVDKLLSTDGSYPGTAVEISDGPVVRGTVVQRTTPYERLIISDLVTITEFEPPRLISLRGTRSYLHAPGSTSTRRYAIEESSGTTIYEPVPTGTRITASIQLWVSGVNPLWHPLLLPAYGREYKRQFHNRMDALLDEAEGPSLSRKAVSFLRQLWWGWIAFALALVALLWVHAAHEQLGISGPGLQVLRVVIGLMAVGALLGGYLMATVRTSRW